MTPIAAPDEVEERLRALAETIKLRDEDSIAIARLEGFRIPRRPVRAQGRSHLRLAPVAGAIAGFLTFVVLANIVAAYLAPSYGRAVADAPGIGPLSSRILQAVGLSQGDVTALNDVATSNGHTIRLAGGYADALRTVLFLEVDGRGLTGDPKAFGRNPGDYGPFPDDVTLTDQFGHSYGEAGVEGGTELGFEPLAWPATQVGARLTLHLTGLIAIWQLQNGPMGATVTGDWTLHAVLFSEPANSTTLPAPLVLPKVTYAFTSIRASGTTLAIRFSISGEVVDELVRLQRAGQVSPSQTGPFWDLSHQYLWPLMFDSKGNQLVMSDWGFTYPKAVGQAIAGEINAYIQGPGSYRIQFGAALSAPESQRWIVVS